MRYFLTLILISLLAASAQAQGETPVLQLQTSYPAPLGNYQKLSTTYFKLNPIETPGRCGTDVPAGSLYYDTDGIIYYCNGAEWVYSYLSLWARDDTKKSLYPIDIPSRDSNFKIGIGTTDPQFKLTLKGDASFLAEADCVAVTLGPIKRPGEPPEVQFTNYCSSYPSLNTGIGLNKLLWYAPLGVFRAGYASNDQWDSSNVGTFSVAMGVNNMAKGYVSTIPGGLNNTAEGDYSAILGGSQNLVEGWASAITAGDQNKIKTTTPSSPTTPTTYSTYSSILGGQLNQIIGDFSMIGGGEGNNIHLETPTFDRTGGYGSGHATISGGENNNIENADFAAIGGGNSNIISADDADPGSPVFSTIAGGLANRGSGPYTTVSGGYRNKAKEEYSTVSGGLSNEATGKTATVPGGESNIAGGDYSFAGGRNMQLSSSADRTFVWGYSNTPVTITNSDSFIILSEKVGIGVASPATSLDVGGNTSIHGYLSSYKIGIGEIPTVSGPYLDIKPPITDSTSDIVRVRTNMNTSSLTINHVGNVGIKRAPSLSYSLDVEGSVNAYRFHEYSDINLKENITPLTNALTRVNQLRGVNFKWKDQKKYPGPQMGLIAQEVEKIFPEVVSTGDDGYKSISYGSLTAALVEAVKELKTEVDELKEENSRLKEELKRLEDKK